MNEELKHKWGIIEDGYHKRWRYVAYPTGRIVGEVSGSIVANESWSAARATHNER